MKPLPLSILRRLSAARAVPLGLFVALVPTLHATDIYWDSDGATAGGSSGTTATGNWGTSAFWSTDATGAADTTATWASTDTAVFSAGSDVTGVSTITVNANTVAAGLKVEEGNVTFVSATSTKSLTVNSGLIFDKTVTFGAASAATNVNLLLGTNTLTLNNGANVALYGTANTMGNVNINGGFLLIRGSSNTGALGTTGTVTLGAASGGDAATLRIGDTATVARPIALGGTTGTLLINNVGFGTDTKLTGGVTGTNKLSIQSVISSTSAGKVTASTGKLDFTGALTLETTGAGTNASAVGTVIINSEITDKVTSITVQDSSTGTRGIQKVVLGSTANAYTGDTIVSSGILQLGASNVIANGAGKGNVSIAAAGTLDLASFSETINGLSGSGIVDSTVAGTKTLTVGSNDATSTFSGTIKNTTGTLALTKTGTGTLTLTAENSYSGGTTLGNNAGVIEISHGSALGTGTVALTKGGTNGGTLSLTNDITVANNFAFSSATSFGGGGSAHIRNTSGNNTLTGDLTLNATGGNGINIESAAGKLTLGGIITSTVADNTRQLGLGGAGDGEVTGSIQNTGSNAFSVIKSGNGTWTLSGTASYTGSTQVNGGTLRVNTTLSGTSGVTIGAGAKLEGIGSINTGTVAFSGAGTLSAGNSIGIFGLNAADLTNGTLLVEYGTSSIDLLNVAGLLDITGANVNFSQYAGTLDGVNSYIFATYGSLTGGSFLNSFNVPEGYAIDYGSGSNSSISLVAVPEPGSAALGSVVLLALFHRRRS